MNLVSFKKVNNFKELADKVFEQQKERIIKSLPFAEIHHIGSTAILNSVTKGDLDINVRVKGDDFQLAVDELKKLYDINQPENWTKDFASFKDDKNLAIDFGVQVTIIDSSDDDFVKLRDYLIDNPSLVQEYNKMKLKYDGKDMNEYRKEKSDFFQKLREGKPKN